MINVETDKVNSSPRLLTAAAALAATVVLAGCGNASANPEETPSPKICSTIINKASFTYTEYDVAKLFWDGQSQQRTIVDYKFATDNGTVVKLSNKNDYIDIKVGNEYCQDDYGQFNESHPTFVDAKDCDTVTQAEIITEGGIAGSNLFWDGELRSKLDIYPLVTTEKYASVVVDQDKYVLHPVGTEVCFNAQELKKVLA